jgi:hypothetical protein
MYTTNTYVYAAWVGGGLIRTKYIYEIYIYIYVSIHTYMHVAEVHNISWMASGPKPETIKPKP